LPPCRSPKMSRPLLGRGATIPLGYQFESALQMHPWQDLAGIGAPVRVFLLSDLLHERFPSHDIKLAIFLNAFMLAPELRQAIQTKLQVANKTLAWLYAPALFDAANTCSGTGPCVPDMVAASELVGHRLSLNTTAASLSTTFETPPAGSQPSAAGCPPLPDTLVGTSYAGAESWPHDLGLVSPWLSCNRPSNNNTAAWGVLGRYQNKQPSLCWSKSATQQFSSVFIGAPR